MKIREPKCVILKRNGAEYVKKLLEGKTREEELRFWQNRTKILKKRFSKPLISKQ